MLTSGSSIAPSALASMADDSGTRGSHSSQPVASSSTAATSREACHFYAIGKCRNGAKCPFYHGPREEYAVSAYPCKYFLMNSCKAGRNCKFSHVVPEGYQVVNRSTGQVELAPGSLKVPCRFYNEGGCSMGGKCPYLHIDQDPHANGNAKENNKKKPPTSTVKMYSLTRNPSASPAAATAATAASPSTTMPVPNVNEDLQREFFGLVEEQQVTELSDFISKEEEVYYYGAPGEMEDKFSAAAAEIARNNQLNTPISYGEAAKKNLPPPSQEEQQQQQYQQQFYASFPQERVAPPKKCYFFFNGGCRYGDECFYSHDHEEEPDMELSALTLEETKGDLVWEYEQVDYEDQEHQRSADEEVEPPPKQEEYECNICYDRILPKGERFGILSGCDHTFCLSCVRNWRGNTYQPKSTVRACPVCRVETHFIIPSVRMVTDPEAKRHLIDSYRSNVATIPCRHFDRGRGNCPFGTSCFYEHRLEDGTLADRTVRTAVNSQGDYDVLGQVRLGHFLQ